MRGDSETSVSAEASPSPTLIVEAQSPPPCCCITTLHQHCPRLHFLSATKRRGRINEIIQEAGRSSVWISFHTIRGGSLINERAGSLITLKNPFQIKATKGNLRVGLPFKELREAADTHWCYLPSDELFPTVGPLTRLFFKGRRRHGGSGTRQEVLRHRRKKGNLVWGRSLVGLHPPVSMPGVAPRHANVPGKVFRAK